jgi:sugar phosphate permease
VPNLNFVLVCVLFVIFGMASGSQFLTFVMARDLSTHKSVGTAVSFVNMLSMLGGLIFQSGVGYVLDHTPSNLTLFHTPLTNYQIAISIVPLSIGLAFLVTLCAHFSFSRKNIYCPPRLKNASVKI